MKFLEKFIDAINALIEKLIEKFISIQPEFVSTFVHFILHLPQTIKKLIAHYQPKIRIFFLKIIGYSQHYVTLLRGNITAMFIYFRSEEFKKDKTTALIKKPIWYIRDNPLKVLTTASIMGVFIASFYVIGLNSSKIISGTKKRAPASVAEENNDGEDAAEKIDPTVFTIKHHSFEVVIGGGGEGGGHGGGGGAHHEEEIIKGDIKLKLVSEHKKELIEEMEEMVDDRIEAVEIATPSLPIKEEEKVKIEAAILKELNEGFATFANETPIVSVAIDFHQEARPEYYRKNERSFSMQNIDMQVFQEDLNRNHQVYIDFTVVASNRNIVLFLKDHEVLIRDRLSTNVEPILPRLPIEDEGKRIIKDKIRDELNDILKKENIEGRILEVYFDFSMSS